MVQFSQQVVSGTAIGCVYALVALGFVLIFKATEVVNFAQGELMMIGAFLAFTFIVVLGMNFWIGGLLAVVVTALFGGVLDRTVMRPMVGQPVFAIVMVTIGIGFAIRATVSMIPGWGVDTYFLETPFFGKVVRLGELVISQDHLAIIILTVLLVAVLFLFFRYTRLGVAMQATSQNQLAAYYMGIPVKNVFSMIWAISAAVAAFAGLLLAPIAFIHVNMGLLGIKAFPAAVLGGFGSLPGAIVGGLIIGIVEALSGFYLPEGFKDIAAYVVLLAVLIVRPEGLFGQTIRKKV
ncbi:MAG: branched-chain amino acid ABC transporter permease [Alphaproteobacteria bacterium]|nr:branched-chain amino acid ABC transporter permease [Alphaproteobacteria bacterium]MDP6516341.1 branched-chain amino acid ABC transporter permease [Alphaproteobacteria bacterium]